MELHLLYLLWFSALFFTALAYYVRTNWGLMLVAAVGWMATALSWSEVAIYGWDSMGNIRPYYISMGDPHTVGMLGSYYYFWGIGLIFILFTFAWVIMSKKVGDEV
jgi:hypothetical protein